MIKAPGVIESNALKISENEFSKTRVVLVSIVGCDVNISPQKLLLLPLHISFDVYLFSLSLKICNCKGEKLFKLICLFINEL